MKNAIEETPQEKNLRRPIKSYVLRQGRLTPAQHNAIETLAPIYCVAYGERAIDFTALFSRDAETVLEIGFGMGLATAEIAKNYPNINYLGIEVHTPGVGSLLQLLKARELTNVRIVKHDAVEVIHQMIAPETLSGIHVFFPDPWHKKRHHKRRLLQPAFIHELALRLKVGGYLHIATDWEDYAREIIEMIGNETLLINAAPYGFTPRPDTRPRTKFETRGVNLGHEVFDIIATRQ